MSSAASRHWASCISAAAEELSNAAEISCVMEAMLDDLEILQHVNESKRLQRELAECKRTIQKLQEAEAKLLAEQAAATAKLDAERATAGALKDSFAKELWSLTKELRAKEQLKQQLDELQKRVAVLPQLQAELQQARTALAEMETIAVENAVSLSVSNSAAAVDEANGTADAIAASLQSDSALPAEAEAEAAAVVAVPPEQSQLLALPDKSLLAVYSFLQMSDVTSVAATCSAAYCKANALLGIGKSDAVFSSIAKQQQLHQTDTAESDTAVPSDSAITLQATIPATTAATVISATDRPLTYREEMQNGVAAIARQRIQGLQGGVVSLFSAVVGQRTAASAAAASTPMIEQSSSTGVATSSATSSLSSSAHGGTTAATDRDSSSGISGGSNSTATTAASSGSAMTAETVTALSKKLTHAEMRGIIGLTDRLKRMSQTATQYQAERDDLASRLTAAESVKELLMNKLQETETALKQCTDEKELCKRQAASDQEVITFLDARTQEMEKVAAEAMNKALQAQTALEEERASVHRRTKASEDVIRFEKEKAESECVTLRQAKRLLVAEVKKLRQENAELRAQSSSSSDNSGSSCGSSCVYTKCCNGASNTSNKHQCSSTWAHKLFCNSAIQNKICTFIDRVRKETCGFRHRTITLAFKHRSSSSNVIQTIHYMPLHCITPLTADVHTAAAAVPSSV
eukprot:6036-Heterococcus_DN1.PRE.1